MKKYLSAIMLFLLLFSCSDNSVEPLPEDYNPAQGQWEGRWESESDSQTKSMYEKVEFSADRKFSNVVVSYKEDGTKDTLDIDRFTVKDAPYKMNRNQLIFTTEKTSGGEIQRYSIVDDTLRLGSRGYYFLKIK